MKLVIAGLLVVVSLASTFAAAQGSSNRRGTADSSFLLRYQDGATIDYPEGSSVDFESDVGLGFRIGYNYTSQFNAGFQLDWIGVPYTVRLAPADGTSGPQIIRHKADQLSGMFKGIYHFSNSRLTPYVEGGLGWVFVDSNVLSGESTTGCWWLPWGPVVCDRWHYTYTDYNFAYELGLGLRYEPSSTMFVRASVSKKWMNAAYAVSDPDYYTAQIEIGAMVWD